MLTVSLRMTIIWTTLVIYILSVISLSQAYNCYKNTDKASKQLNLASHSGSTYEGVSHRRRKRDTGGGGAGNVLEFEIGDYLHLNDINKRVIRDDFSISAWLYLEGGQPDKGSILALKNKCFGYSPWRLQLSPAVTDRDIKSTMTFIIEDVYRQRKPVTMETYKHHEWFHLAIINDVDSLRMFVNGVKVSTGEGMAWTEFTEIDCMKLEVGHQVRGFRGKLNHLQIFDLSLSSRKVKQLESNMIDISSSAWLDDTFASLSDHWTTESAPSTVQAWSTQKRAQTIKAPPCGKTVCDDPAVIKSYEGQSELKNKKEVRLEILVPALDDGSEPLISELEVAELQNFLERSFESANIEWSVETRILKNYLIRKSLITVDCRPDSIGNNICDKECNLPETYYDGGDCLSYIDCREEMLGNGRCDPQCNIGAGGYYFDYGECCIDPDGLCIAPNSNNRTIYHLSEIQELLETDADKLSLVVVNFLNSQSMVGIASMPWEQHAEMLFGSVVVDSSTLRSSAYLDTIVHELGHVLGLWHVHHGISEVHCDDQCLETHASLELGDLCADTSPTALHTSCSDPDPEASFNIQYCSINEALTNTPYDNFMSYSNGSCSSDKGFTPQQIARMHCYLDLVHSQAVIDRKPSAIPLSIQVVSADSGSVTLSWLPPLASGQSQQICTKCGADGTLTQYAVGAELGGTKKFDELSYDFGPEHATGYPDAAPCKAAMEVWSPSQHYRGLYCVGENCEFIFSFAEPVRPYSIKVWMTWFKVTPGLSPISKIHLVSEDGSIVKRITKVPIQCDKPFTKRIDDVLATVSKIIVYTVTPDIDFDAVELTSHGNSAACEECESFTYKVMREPPMAEETIITETIFEDKTVAEGSTYNYTVVGIVGEVEGVTSRGFLYTHNQQFCGNGQLDGSEECDDGNFISDDGCSPTCRLEEGYRCVGSPSVCWQDEDTKGKHCGYRFTHEKDGCGFYVPQNYSDQWASTVTTIGHHLTCSPSHLLLGPPPSALKCKSSLVELSTPIWQPCQTGQLSGYVREDYALKFGFEKPVVITEVLIHLGSDGSATDMGGSSDPMISLRQIYEDSSDIILLDAIWDLSCKENPHTVSVRQDLSKPFQRTKELILKISSRAISIAALRVRTFENFDPVAINSCRSNLYNIGTNQCAGPIEAKTCLPMEVTNGNLTCTGMSEGDDCNVFCDEGFTTNTISGSSTCIDGRWTPELTCHLVSCDRPVIPLGYATCTDGHHYDSVCNMSCTSPSELIGNGTQMKCLDSGVWTEPRAWCSPVCPDLTTLNAEIVDQRCEGPQELGQKCSFTCQNGFYIEGQDEKKRKGKAECLYSAEWNMKCVRVQCSSLPVVWAGLYQCTDGGNSGSVCTATCPSSQERSVIECLPLGLWNASLAVCDMSDTECPRIENQKNEMNITCNGNNTGSICRPICKDHHKTVHQQVVVGNAIKLTQFRQKLRCTSIGEWTPALDMIQCEQLCREEYIGDGWCDATNNRDMCGYDGGDCCQTTTKAMKVQNFPETCTTECECSDPEARENRIDQNAKRWWRVRNGYAIDRRP